MELSITYIEFAHEFTLTEDSGLYANKSGRGSWGLVYCLEGKANFTFREDDRNKTVEVQKNDVLLLPRTSVYSIKPSEPFRHYTINFGVEESILSAPDCPDFLKDTYTLIRTEKQSRFEYFFETVANAWKYKPPFHMLQCMSYVYRILFYVATEHRSLTQHPYNQPQIFKAAKYLDEHWNENLTAEELAAMCNMGVSHFRHLFKKTFGMTPAEYRNARVVKYAKEYLASGYYTVGEVSQLCGFTDPNYFSRFMKKQTGHAPGKLIRR